MYVNVNNNNNEGKSASSINNNNNNTHKANITRTTPIIITRKTLHNTILQYNSTRTLILYEILQGFCMQPCSHFKSATSKHRHLNAYFYSTRTKCKHTRMCATFLQVIAVITSTPHPLILIPEDSDKL
jgi:hypothetical protein